VRIGIGMLHGQCSMSVQSSCHAQGVLAAAATKQSAPQTSWNARVNLRLQANAGPIHMARCITYHAASNGSITATLNVRAAALDPLNAHGVLAVTNSWWQQYKFHCIRYMH
jgi:hypothetical protein